MIKFRSKFQILLQFYRTVEKVGTCDGNGQKFWQVPPSFQLSHFGYYFAFSWLRFKHTEWKVIYANLSIAFKTALIFFASAVMKLKHLPTTYFTILPIKTKEWPFWTKSKVLIVAFRI